METFADLVQRGAHPNEMQLKFGLKFSASGGVLVAGVSGESALEATLIYKAADVIDGQPNDGERS
jgi:Trypsin-co-occurring domain 1